MLEAPFFEALPVELAKSREARRSGMRFALLLVSVALLSFSVREVT